MKKIIIAAAALLMCSTSSFAQNFEWGVKGGLNLATITDVDDLSMKPSIYVGVFAEFNLVEDFLGLQPELVFSRQGAADDDLKLRMNYINLPIMFKLYVLDALSLDLGPQFGVMINSKFKDEIDGRTVTSDTEGLKNFDVSFGVGLSYKIAYRFDVSARYNLGLTKVTDVDGSKSKNGVIQLGAGYRF